MIFKERALRFPCHNSWLYGILSLPEQAASRGVLILVGGPQYRVGSHRQFTLLARHLAAQGVPVMRFDCRGMGDSEGQMRTFEEIEDDLLCAINQFFHEISSLKELVIWGLCDAASAALFYAYQDPRVTGLVLLNPWVRTDQGIAKTYLKHYYFTRLFDPELWNKVKTGRINYIATIKSFYKNIISFLAGKKKVVPVEKGITCNMPSDDSSLPERMFNGFNHFNGKILLVTSGDDFTAQEFLDLVGGSKEWKKALASANVKQFNLPSANHTFSRREWRDQVAIKTCEWVKSYSNNEAS